ncbi:MFS transporter [Actinoallomurus iriomotensis]|uniref:MFS transporter n=1 Tax=Actinoallomurus iriomotensis TaxID=478107 RepID=A0A9W6VVZ1_9ACTN|nr:MFS transporter [Actinoallomurus iriomotensis]GLY81082.1 MFS transporter [Actinoallomurus iriomotensis]
MSHRQIMEALSGLLLGLFVTILSSTVVSNALPTIIADLHASQTTYTWVITGTLLSMTITTPIWGKLADLVSKKLLIQLALVIFVAGSAIAGQAHNPAMLITARVVQGLGAGGLSALVQVIMAAMISPRERGRYSGYTGAVFALATVGGPLIGGVIVDTSWLGWRWCFYVGVPFAVIALIVLQKTLHLPTARRKVKVDWLGATLFSGAAALLLLWVSFAGDKYDWLSWQTAAMIGGAVVLAVLFVVAETFASEPIVPLRLFRIRTLSLSTLASLFVGVAMFGATTFLSQYFQLARGDSPTKAGLMTLPMIGGLAVASTISGRIVSSTGRWKYILVLGAASMTVGYALLSTIRYDTAYWQVAVYMFCVGAGLGMTMQNLVLCVQNQVRTQELGVASSTVSFFRSLGGAIGVSALGAALGNRITHYMMDGLARIGVHTSGTGGSLPKLSALPAPIRRVVQDAYGHGIGNVFLYAAPCALIAVIVILFIKEVPLRTSNTQPAPAGVAPSGRHAQRREPELVPAGVGNPVPAVDGQVTALATGVEESPDAGAIRGVVRNGGVPVARAVITLIDVRGRQIGRATTRDDGRYALPAPGSGTYVLIAAAGDHDPQAATLVVGDRPIDFDVTLTGSGGLAGTVRGAGGAPVEGAMVVVTDARGEVVAGGTTDAGGGFLFPAVTAGVYTLAVSATSYRPAAVPVEVGNGLTRQEIELLPGVRVHGTIRAEGRGPIPDARVTLLDAAGNVVGVTMTGPDGEYAFTGLREGEYTVTATGYPQVTSGVDLARQGEDAHDLWLGHPAG